MRALDAERVEQRRRIRRHVVERIGDVGLPAVAQRLAHGLQVGDLSRPFLRQADIAVVEADIAQARLREALSVLLRPSLELGAEAVVFDLDSVGANLRHAAFFASTPATKSPTCLR